MSWEPDHSATPPTDGGSPTVVLVTGAGRSGTSSLAGSLKRLGLHIPQPEMEPRPNNPKGYYEPEWVIKYHVRWLRKRALRNIDTRPPDVSGVDQLWDDEEAEQELSDWLVTQLDHPQIVIKDPHAYWFAPIWHRVAAEHGVALKFLTAVRHPAEVVGSRDLAYMQNQPEWFRRTKEIANVAGWVNAALLTEQAGRGGPRAFLKYTDLLADWRSTLGQVRDQLDLEFNDDLAGGPHSVDEFLDTGMRNSQLTWEDVTVPAHLGEMAEEVWQLLSTLTDKPHDQTTSDRLDELHREYDGMYRDAMALTYDHHQAGAVLETRQVKQRNARLRKRIKKQQRRLQRLQERVDAAEERSEEHSDEQPDGPGPLASWLPRRLRRS